jgi:hypothetical protein
MVYIYASPENVNRLNYIARHIFDNILGIGFRLVAEKALFLQQAGACINYSTESLNHGLHIVPQGLLSENGVRKIQDMNESEWRGFFCFFRQTTGDIPFDVFSASFYLLTLYAEYLPEKLDRHGRFREKESLAYRNGFLETPLIDRWAYLLKEELEKKYAGLEFHERNYRFVNSFDIDHPYLFLKKGLIKTVGGTAKDLLNFRFKNTIRRLAVHLRLKPDPYFEAIRWIDGINKDTQRTYRLFVLLGKTGKYGRSTIYPTSAFYKYLRNLENVEIGLHPSYDTYANLPLLLKEKKQMENILKRPVVATRQHFLRMHNPETFQALNIAGFKEDFTLAFARAPGFRSATAIPHYFYDIEKEESTGLLLHPTVMMDTTLITHLKLSPEEALCKIKTFIDECKKSGGDYVSLWHNSNLAGENNPWKKVFIESIHYAISSENNNFAPA